MSLSVCPRLSPCPCARVSRPVRVSVRPCPCVRVCPCVPVRLSLSVCPCPFVPVRVSVCPCPFVPVRLSLSVCPCPCVPVRVALPVWPCPCGRVAVWPCPCVRVSLAVCPCVRVSCVIFTTYRLNLSEFVSLPSIQRSLKRSLPYALNSHEVLLGKIVNANFGHRFFIATVTSSVTSHLKNIFRSLVLQIFVPSLPRVARICG